MIRDRDKQPEHASHEESHEEGRQHHAVDRVGCIRGFEPRALL